ncbi:hypothetical protein TOT_010000880 [Theileria orientalis strain Shintoku]|uniref:Uncharacterized protein n=1 Tax=Theileria orientalis strain Shintoku TaxID=869250 RepID=J4DNR6_THEOR|nr:hypothetical protein TOT_010000880 [Theileria orientalis strain Shintoku]BAM39424.1 hypothetical protein TOT_010000880 [Theileria orientalis strain Shintoku]|eukprot:XP_009689725.1 hypothetical protein TOT_010000880 [Theileria orientalis strain Shintoku]
MVATIHFNSPFYSNSSLTCSTFHLFISVYSGTNDGTLPTSNTATTNTINTTNRDYCYHNQF